MIAHLAAAWPVLAVTTASYLAGHFLGAILDLVDADDAARDRALGIRHFVVPAESPDADRYGLLLAYHRATGPSLADAIDRLAVTV